MTWMPVLDGSVMLVTAVAAVTDLRSGKVPNWLTLPALAAGPALWGMLGGWSGLETSALGLAVGFLPLFVFYRSGPLLCSEVVMREFRPFGFVPRLPVIEMPPWLVAYLAIAIPFVFVLKWIFRIY